MTDDRSHHTSRSGKMQVHTTTFSIGIPRDRSSRFLDLLSTCHACTSGSSTHVVYDRTRLTLEYMSMYRCTIPTRVIILISW